ncbi:MAG: class I SAM-dependent methyltransferase [Pontixanthobacter sp.]
MATLTLRQLVKKGFAFTPYEIVRKRKVDQNFDAVAHNTLFNVDKLFGDQKFLANYNNPTRTKFHFDTKELVLDAVDPSMVQTIGDFGCGTGDFFSVLMPEFEHCELHGYDFANATLAAARIRNPRAIYHQHDLYEGADRRHDLVICSQTIEHLLEPQMALKTLIDATAPGGLLVLTVPDGRSDTFKGHLQFWSPESWASWIGRHVKAPHEIVVMANGTMGGSNLAAIIRP